MEKKLKNINVAILVTDGFEDRNSLSYAIS